MNRHKERFPWWGYVKNIIRRYPALRLEHEQSLLPKATADYSGEPHGSGISRPVENAVVKAISAGTYAEYSAVAAAIKEAEALPDGKTRLKIVDMVFWQQTHTLTGAANAAYVSPRSARRWVSEFIKSVAKNRGLL